jgi:hypothetical protein
MSWWFHGLTSMGWDKFAIDQMDMIKEKRKGSYKEKHIQCIPDVKMIGGVVKHICHRPPLSLRRWNGRKSVLFFSNISQNSSSNGGDSNFALSWTRPASKTEIGTISAVPSNHCLLPSYLRAYKQTNMQDNKQTNEHSAYVRNLIPKRKWTSGSSLRRKNQGHYHEWACQTNVSKR